MNASVRRELTVALRSFRLPGFAIVLLFFALLDPPTVKYMDKLIEQLSGAGDIQIIMPTPTPAMALTQFLGDVSGIGAFALVLLLMGAVASERATGVTEWVLTRPVTRREYLDAKVWVWSIGVVACALVAGLIAWLYTWSLLGPVDFRGIAAALIALVSYLVFVAAITFTGSVMLKSQLAAGFVGIGGIFVGVLIKPIGSRLGIGRYLPYSLPDMGTRALDGAAGIADVLPAAVCALVVSALLLVYAYRRFASMQL